MSEAPPEADPAPEPPRPTPLRSLLRLGSAKVITTLTQLGTVVYLTSTLGPEPFGLLAMVLALVNFLYALRDGGIGESLVSEADLTPSHRGAAVLILGVLSLALTLLSLLLTPAVIAFYGQPELLWPWICVALLTPIHLLASIPQALAQREERFGLIGGTQVLSRVASSLAAVALAWWEPEPTVYPLVVLYGLPPTITLLVLGLALRPRLGWPSRVHVDEMLVFVKGVVGFNLSHVFVVNADDLLIGRYLGKEALGFYDLCFRIMTFPTRFLTNLVRSVALPRLSRLAKEDPAQVAPALAQSMRSVGVLFGPLALTISVAAPELIPLVFGEAWLPSLEAFQILALLSLIRAVFSLCGLAFIVSRDTRGLARWGFVVAPILVFSYALGLPWGILGVAISQTVFNVLILPLMVRHARRALEDTSLVLLTEPVKGMALGCLAGLFPCAVLLATRQAELAPALRLGLTIAAGALVQGGLVYRLRARIVG